MYFNMAMILNNLLSVSNNKIDNYNHCDKTTSNIEIQIRYSY